MRNLLLIAFSLILFSCSSNDEQVNSDMVNNPNTASSEAEAGEMPVMTFEEEMFDFGSISQGEKVEHEYKFSNTGKSELIIASAKGSCGCTVPDWPKRPIPAGGSASIKVKFDSNGKSGRQHKKVTIVANTQPSTNVIAITGEVIAPE